LRTSSHLQLRPGILHMLWSCDKLTPVWDNVCATILLGLGIYIHSSPRLCLLGNVNIGDQYQRTFGNLDRLAAIKIKAINWKAPYPPSMTNWN
jgi:hypothetical protein